MNNLKATADVVVVARGTKDGKNELLYTIGLAQDGNVGTFFVTKEIYESVEGKLYQNFKAEITYIESQQYGNRLRLTNLYPAVPEVQLPFQDDIAQPAGEEKNENKSKK